MLILFILLLLFLAALVFQAQAYRLRPSRRIPAHILTELQSLADMSLASGEVPVGAILVYGDDIIGRGINTVVRDKNLGGHAELNALNDAHLHFQDQWKQLDRSRLVLYSTYEPCEMCKGGMLNFNIYQAVFEEPKTVREHVVRSLKRLRYEWKKERLFAPGMQAKLFERHPDYPLAK